MVQNNIFHELVKGKITAFNWTFNETITDSDFFMILKVVVTNLVSSLL